MKAAAVAVPRHHRAAAAPLRVDDPTENASDKIAAKKPALIFTHGCGSGLPKRVNHNILIRPYTSHFLLQEKRRLSEICGEKGYVNPWEIIRSVFIFNVQFHKKSHSFSKHGTKIYRRAFPKGMMG